jgi:hypothetical protein
MKAQIKLLIFFCGAIIGCKTKLPGKINIVQRMEDGSDKEKEIANKDSIRQIVNLLNQRHRTDRVIFYMEYDVELIYSNNKLLYFIGGEYMKTGDRKTYQLNQPDKLLKLLSVDEIPGFPQSSKKSK